MKAHRCTQHTEGWCDACDAEAERRAEWAAEHADERESWNDDALWSYTPDFGDQLTKGGW